MTRATAVLTREQLAQSMKQATARVYEREAIATYLDCDWRTPEGNAPTGVDNEE